MSEKGARIHSAWLWLVSLLLGAVAVWCAHGAIQLSGMLMRTEYGLAMPPWASRQFLMWMVGAALSTFAMIAVLFQLLIRRLQRPSRRLAKRPETRAAGK